jgi:hypothetical protein
LQTGSQTFLDFQRLTDIKKSLEKICRARSIAS